MVARGVAGFGTASGTGREDGATSDAPIRVLIAEDDTAVRSALAELVEMTQGLQLAGAVGDAKAAADAAASLRPDVAVVDVRMPDGGGARAAREIGARAPFTRVICFSAYADRSTVLEMLRAGATSYVVKGVDASALLDAIQGDGPGRVQLPPGELDELIADLATMVRALEADMEAVTARTEHVLGETRQRVGEVLGVLDAALEATERNGAVRADAALAELREAAAMTRAVMGSLNRSTDSPLGTEVAG